MKFQKSAITLVAIMALVAANTAFAGILCSPPTPLGNGLVQMSVSSVGADGLIAVPTFTLTGAAVSADVGDCTIGATSCTVSATGTSGGGEQSVLFLISDSDDSEWPCEITENDGLPVELNKYSVE